jgi:hypothetical protein
MESHFPYTVTDDKPLIFAGSVPKEVPFPVPIPEDFVLVGSAQFASRGDRRMVEIVLDTALSASGVRDAYRNLLSGGAGRRRTWTVPVVAASRAAPGDS